MINEMNDLAIAMIQYNCRQGDINIVASSPIVVTWRRSVMSSRGPFSEKYWWFFNQSENYESLKETFTDMC